MHSKWPQHKQIKKINHIKYLKADQTQKTSQKVTDLARTFVNVGNVLKSTDFFWFTSTSWAFCFLLAQKGLSFVMGFLLETVLWCWVTACFWFCLCYSTQNSPATVLFSTLLVCNKPQHSWDIYPSVIWAIIRMQSKHYYYKERLLPLKTSVSTLVLI